MTSNDPKPEIPFTHERYMRMAIAAARKGLKKGQTPFGACVVYQGKIVATAHNQVWKNQDITAHAEIMAIRRACRRLQTIDLSGCVIYSTCEPCPMCFSAIHWARISSIYFGALIADAQASGFNELPIDNHLLKKQAGSEVVIVSGFLASECRELFAQWKALPGMRTY